MTGILRDNALSLIRGVGGPRIMLTMIVKNESKVIRRCLESVKPYIHGWCIVDTGSADNTKAIVLDSLSGIPGQLFEREWLNFGHNRTESIQLARGLGQFDYHLVIDADEEFFGSIPANLSAPIHAVMVYCGGKTFPRPTLLAKGWDWVYVGRVHETVTPLIAGWETRVIHDAVIVARPDGGRHEDPSWLDKDIEAAQQDIAEDPTFIKMFHLAQMQECHGYFDDAIGNYLASLGGAHPEVAWYALYRIAECMRSRCNGFSLDVVEAYKNAIAYRPSRNEPIHRLSSYMGENGYTEASAELLELAKKIETTEDSYMVDVKCYSGMIA